MTSLDQKRRERARNGSRRKRDLDALQPERPDWDAYLAEHFPDEFYGYALMAAHRCYLAQPKRSRSIPNPADVRAEMERKGWTRKQLEEAPACR